MVPQEKPPRRTAIKEANASNYAKYQPSAFARETSSPFVVNLALYMAPVYVAGIDTRNWVMLIISSIRGFAVPKYVAD